MIPSSRGLPGRPARAPRRPDTLRLASLSLVAIVVVSAVFNHVFEPWLVARLGIPDVLDEAALALFAVLAYRVVAASARSTEDRNRRLTEAVEAASGSIILASPAGYIEYVNPAFERATGWTREEIVGRHHSAIFPGIAGSAVWHDLAEALKSPGTWSGEWVLPTRDGRVIREEATVAALRDANGRAHGYVVVTRDVTRERQAAESLEQEVRERAAVSAGLARLQPAATAEATAEAVCREIAAIEGVDHASVIEFRAPGDAVVLARLGPGWPGVEHGKRLPPGRARYLANRAAGGPWAQRWVPRPQDGAYGRALAESGVRAVAYAPIRNGDGLLGLVLLATHDEARAEWMLGRSGIAVEFASTAGALLAGWLEADRRDARSRTALEQVIAERAFEPLFQPIVELATGAVFGYEALTRFAGGCRPDACFIEAWRVGLGPDLEEATLSAAAAAARGLPAGTVITLNASPRMVLEAPDRLRAILDSLDRPAVLELTEHDDVRDYAALRYAIAGLGRDLGIAVDDAGAGAASLGHIVELRPDYVKLDKSLVQGIASDAERRAMVLGMRHFAAAAGCRLVAEGVETVADAAAVGLLGVQLAQGFLYGRPEPVPSGDAMRVAPALAGRAEGDASGRRPEPARCPGVRAGAGLTASGGPRSINAR